MPDAGCNAGFSNGLFFRGNALAFSPGPHFLCSNNFDESSPENIVNYRTPIAQLLVVVELVVPVVA